MSDRSLRLGVFGFGCVGTGLYETLCASEFTKAEIVRICVKNPDKPRSAPEELFTLNAADILEDESIDTVVELIDDADAAYEIVTQALKSGKNVVTANKKLIAEHLDELIRLQRETGRSLLYEAACAASIPIIRNLEEYYDNDLLRHLEGVLNGSTNFILSALERGGDYETALRLAQEKGFAETDPTLDVEGWDAKFKLTILLAHSFGIVVHPDRIPHLGITGISPGVQRVAGERHQRIKLVGRCFKEGNKVRAWVWPTFTDDTDELSGVDNAVNGVVVEGAFSQRQFFLGEGAGSLPTGAAVLSDISALTYGYRYEYKKLRTGEELVFEDDFPVWVHLNGKGEEPLPIHAFEEIVGTFRSASENYVEGRIGIRNLLELIKSGTWSVVALSNRQSEEYKTLSNNSITILN